MCFPFQRTCCTISDFCRYFFWPDVLDGLKEMFTRTQFVCDQGGYFPEIKVDFIPDKWIQSSFLQSGASWEIHHEAASWVPGLAEDAATEREVLVCDNRSKVSGQKNLAAQFLWILKKRSCCDHRRENSFMFNDNAFSGSHVDFASHVASYALGEDWWVLFDPQQCLLSFDGQERFVWYRHLLCSKTLLLHRPPPLLETWGGKGGKMCGQIGDRCSDWVSNVLLT